MPGQWLIDATAAFGATCKAKLAGPGEPEAAIRAPIEQLLAAAGQELSLTVVPHDEVRDNDRGVRPDYAIRVNGAITGYVEVKKPGANLDPESFTGHNLKQWERQRDLPNLVYTNGTEWRLYRDSQPVGDPVHLTGGTLRAAGSRLSCGDDFETLLTDFLRWRPVPITGVVALVRAVAPLCRLLRGEVLDQLEAETRAIAAGANPNEQPFHGLARDWRTLLFPTASDAVFADGYAQAVTFALLLARTEDIDVEAAGGLHNVGTQLASQHSLMSRALQLLTDYVAADFKVTLDLLVRVVGAVDWPQVRAGNRDTYLHLYERFLEEYDPALRRLSGSYYTPHQVIEQMVRLSDETLVNQLDRPDGFGDPSVVVADPAMGTGGYLQHVIEHVADRVEKRDGKGAVAAAVRDLATRLYGFELQMGPFAVAELRVTDLLADLRAALPQRGLGLFVTDTLDDPYAEQTQLGSGLELISRSRSRAAKVKAKTKVTVVIGNPPYRERADGMGGWIENGNGADPYRPLDDFRAPGNGRAEYNLKNLYIYFWRWGTWKVFDANAALPDGDTGVVCYITTSGYLRGPGFKGMREYLRRNASEGWVIDVSPEGIRPDVATRIFPGVQQPLAITLFTRKPDCDLDTPAPIHYTAVHGHREDKYQALAGLNLHGPLWRDARTAWQAPFTPAAQSQWDDYPALNDLLPWSSTGLTANRNWPSAPTPTVLKERLKALIAEPDSARKSELFKETRDRNISSTTAPLIGADTEQNTGRPLTAEGVSYATSARIVRYGYRFLARQWIVADSRLLDFPRPPLWAARIPGQIFVVEMHSKPITNGPGVVFSSLIPDTHHFRGSQGGRTLPVLHPGGRPNVANGLLGALSTIAGRTVSVYDLVAYIAGVTSHPAYTEHFEDELSTPGIRIPITTNADLFQRAIDLGREVIWLHSYGDAFSEGHGEIRYPVGDPRRVSNIVAVDSIPSDLTYDAATSTLHVGSGSFGPVPQGVWDYAIDDKEVIRSWFNYRKASPTGLRTSPLDNINATAWPAEWNGELIDLLTVLARLVELQPAQADLLAEILGSPVASHADLAAAGVTWPTTAADRQRRPDSRIPVADEDTEPGQIGFTFGDGAS